MALPYSVHLRQEAFEFLQSRKKRERDDVLGFLRQLAANPFIVGDFEESDDAGRPIQGVILGKLGVYF